MAIPRIAAMPQSQRMLRRPQHTFHVRHTPFAITPFMVAPVLPGETLKNLLHQSRAVSDPVKNPLIGWWLEYYFFYVKHRDLNERDDLTNMMITPGWTPAAGTKDDTTSTDWYHPGSAGSNFINWAKLCTIRIVEEYFRNDGEAWNTAVIGNYPAAQVNVNTWLDSAVTASDYVSSDLNVDLNADTTIKASEVESALRQWEFLRMNNLTNQTYEEYLMTYGVRPTPVESHRPELIRFERAWQYPSNSVDPTTGVPSSALSWSPAIRADKDRYFKEPGFVIGLTVARPKVYFSKQAGSLASCLNDVYAWLPSTLRANAEASLRKLTTTKGPLLSQAADYWVDLKDLLVYGDQFINFSLAATDAGMVALPTAALQKRYPTEAEAKALFSDAVNKYQVRQDGIVHLTIAGTIMDDTPSVNV